jgi:predicted dinucleotide-binding enzyme
VLIVEDEEALRVLAESIIQHHGYEALSAGTVEQACAFSKATRNQTFCLPISACVTICKPD